MDNGKKVILIANRTTCYKRCLHARLSPRAIVIGGEKISTVEKIFEDNKKQLDLIVLDTGMFKDIAEALRVIKKFSENFTGKIIATSLCEKTNKQLEEAGCNIVISKSLLSLTIESLILRGNV